MKLQFISDVACPWCAIGLNSLEMALARLGDGVKAELSFEPFELNPDMPPEGRKPRRTWRASTAAHPKNWLPCGP